MGSERSGPTRPTHPKHTPPERVEPLPEGFPKLAIDDPDAPERVKKILASPAYVRADRDPELLNRDALRHARLELEYLKTELAMQKHGIKSTIVLFGGTRVLEPAAAIRQVDKAQGALKREPDNTRLQRKLEVAQRVLAKSKYYDVAREFARTMSELCMKAAPGEFVITTGGGPGIMEAANRGAFDAGRESIGLNITLPMEQYPNAYITPELCFQFRYFALRKLHFLKRAKALVAFPGGYGTFDELFEALCLVQTRKIDPMPIILVGQEFWKGAFDADFLAAEGVISEEDIDAFQFAETADEISAVIQEWYGDLSAQS